MKRIAEPELMLDPAQARAYAQADFTQPHDSFVTLLGSVFPALEPERILDLGCGPADICRRLARRYPQSTVLGLDASQAMLQEGEEANRREGFAERIELQRAYLPNLPPLASRFDLIVSNSLLHHLATPETLWETIEKVAEPATPIFIMDLRRPPSPKIARDLVAQYARAEPDVLRQDFENSLYAAYRTAEIHAQLSDTALATLRIEEVGDRHLIIHGAA